MSGTRWTYRVGTLVAVGVVVLTGLTAPSATAAPPTGSSTGDSLDRYERLSSQADRLNERINAAQVRVHDLTARADRATADIARAGIAERAARAKEDRFRRQVDKLTVVSFGGNRLSRLSALLTGTSARDFLDRAEDLESLAEDNDAVLAQLAGAVRAAEAAKTRARRDRRAAADAATAAQALLDHLNDQKVRLRQEIGQVEGAVHQLSGQQRTDLATDTGPSGTYVAPAGVAGRAMRIALAQRGKAYLWGGAGPRSFDCSGLIRYAYAQAGEPGIPHSAAVQQNLGVAVPRADLRPGDLVFFGSPAYHDGIYVGNGLMVDAPHTGAVVRVEPLFDDYSGARRLGG